jgi:hypothetical protein
MIFDRLKLFVVSHAMMVILSHENHSMLTDGYFSRRSRRTRNDTKETLLRLKAFRNMRGKKTPDKET